MTNYIVPRSEWPGEKPPPASSKVGQLSATPSAYQMQLNGITSLSELALDSLQLGLGVDSSQGQVTRIPASMGNEFEGVTSGTILAVDLAGQGAGGLATSQGAEVYGEIKPAAELSEDTYDPSAPQNAESTPAPAVYEDPETGQTIVVVKQDEETFEPVDTVSYAPDPFGEAEEVKPVIGEDWG